MTGPPLAPARQAPKFPRQVIAQAGPWNVLDDSFDISHAGPNVARRMENVIPIDGGSLVGRPGATIQGNAAPTTAIQAHGQLTTQAGTEITYRIVNGVIQTYTWATTTWATVVTAANFATATITISTTARFACVNFNGKLLAHDGINVAWTWDGTAGAAGLTKTTQAAVWYGVPAVKDARVFAIQAANRNTFEYSNINNAITGYATASQTWAFGQVDETPLTALMALNDVLIAFRARSCQAIIGKVTATWSTDGTRAGLSETIGTSSPWGVCERNGEVWFIDSDGRPQVVSARQGPSGVLISVGPDAAPMWHRVRETLKIMDLKKLAQQTAIAYDQFDTILFSNTLTTGTNSGVWLVIDPVRKEPIGTWTGFEVTAPAIVKDASLRPVLMFSANSDGFSYTYAAAISTGIWNDALNAGTVAVQATVEPTPIQSTRTVDVDWDELHTTLRAFTAQAVSVSVRTPLGGRQAQQFTMTGSAFVMGISKIGVDALGGDPREKKRTVGLGSTGRWIVPTYSHNTLNEWFGLVACEAWGVATTDNPQVR